MVRVANETVKGLVTVRLLESEPGLGSFSMAWFPLPPVSRAAAA